MKLPGSTAMQKIYSSKILLYLFIMFFPFFQAWGEERWNLDPNKTNIEESNKAVLKTRGLDLTSQEPLSPLYFVDGCHDDAAHPLEEMTTESEQILRKSAVWLKAHPEVSVELVAHCDERGTNNYILGKAGRRSSHVKQLLIQIGVEAFRLHDISYGQEKPVCTESQPLCWARNNRVDMHIIQK